MLVPSPSADSRAFKLAMKSVLYALKLQPDMANAPHRRVEFYTAEAQYELAIEQSRMALLDTTGVVPAPASFFSWMNSRHIRVAHGISDDARFLQI